MLYEIEEALSLTALNKEKGYSMLLETRQHSTEPLDYPIITRHAPP